MFLTLFRLLRHWLKQNHRFHLLWLNTKNQVSAPVTLNIQTSRQSHLNSACHRISIAPSKSWRLLRDGNSTEQNIGDRIKKCRVKNGDRWRDCCEKVLEDCQKSKKRTYNNNRQRASFVNGNMRRRVVIVQQGAEYSNQINPRSHC